MNEIQVKICGITRVDDAIVAAEAGADAIGLNFYKRSERFVEPEIAASIADAVRDRAAIVGVFVNLATEEIFDIVKQVGLTHVQLHGDEQPAILAELKSKLPESFNIRAVRVSEDDFESAQSEIDQWQTAGVDALLLDAASIGAFGGTGKQLNWAALNQLSISVPWLLAGGLGPNNVAVAIETCKPNGVDVASGVESNARMKDADSIRQFVLESNL